MGPNHYICGVMSTNTDQPSTPRRRHRLILLAVVVILALPVLAAAVLIARFNPNRYAPQLIAAVERTTGRQLTIDGPITLRLSLRPVIVLHQLSLANPPGFADANLVTLDRVEAQLALLPLLSHRIDVLHLHLVDPRMVLERNSAGTPDWIFGPPTPASPLASAAPTSPPAAPAPLTQSATGQNYKIALQEVDISNGQLTVNNKAGSPTIISLPSFSGTAASLDAPLHLNASAEIGATPFTLAGTVQLGSDTTAHVRTGSLLGQRVLTVESAGSGRLHPMAVIPVSRTSSPYSLSEALGDLTTDIAGTNTETLNQSLDTLSATLNQVAPQLGPAFDGVTRLSQTLNGRNHALGELLHSAGDATKILSQRSQQLNTLILNASDLLDVLVTRRQAIVRLLASTSAVAPGSVCR